jgi:cytidylate kinase
MIIAIDGPAASGKGTIARALAAHYSLPHLDTGALYRAVALACLDLCIALDDARQASRVAASLDVSLLGDPRLRSESVAQAASIVSAHPPVRAALLAFQRGFADQPGGAVLDGRDIGTVIAPRAEAKLFVTATPQVRARRRLAELTRAGRSHSYEEVLSDIEQRDRRDSARSAAPLVIAADASLLDTSDLDIAAAIRRATELVEARAMLEERPNSCS